MLIGAKLIDYSSEEDCGCGCMKPFSIGWAHGLIGIADIMPTGGSGRHHYTNGELWKVWLNISSPNLKE